ncbi:60 kDa chaperonin [Paraburkholderia rhynchosiae]|uniref:60 kDa chaperonin n=1 Tax=Paraburkholderia rhynchosiae TaxID=487049 RepID=A0A6J5C1X7_9BURK|nr:60 kDa chaperonin [Paraburkholderia rhynchosiae]
MNDRVDDALHGTRAAVQESIVPGGGMALISVKQAIGGPGGVNADQDADIKMRAART